MPATRKINSIVISLCANDFPSTCSFECIERLHITPITRGVWYDGRWNKGKGMWEIAYHFFINKKGRTEQGRRAEKAGGIPLVRQDTLEICLGCSKDNVSVVIMEELISLIKNLCVIFSLNPLEAIELKEPNEKLKATILSYFKLREKLLE